MSLSEERLKEIKARCEKATPPPWRHEMIECSEGLQARVWAPNDDTVAIVFGNLGIDEATNDFDVASFIAHSRQDVPDLCAEVERLRAAVFALTRSHEGEEPHPYNASCSACQARVKAFGHWSDAAARKALGGSA